MMKTKLIAICVLAILLLIGSSTVKANQIVDEVGPEDEQPGTNFFPGGPTSGFLISDPNWGWTHTFDFAGPLPPSSITSATLEIRQFGVGSYDEHRITLDGVTLESVGGFPYLDNGFPSETSHTTVFVLDSVDIANLLDETANIWMEIDYPNSVAIYWSRLTINYVPAGLDHIVISGPTEVQEDSGAQYTCTAHFIDSSTSDVTNSASWTDDCLFASFDTNGFLTTSSVLSDEPCEIKAAFGNETDTKDIEIKNVLPTVSISTMVPIAAEPDFGGVFEVSREGSTKEALRVFYNTGGTADPGQDYVALPGFVDIPPGESSAAISVIVIDDDIEEDTETVIVNLIADPDVLQYKIGLPSSATVNIVDDEGAPPMTSGHIPAKNSVQVARDTIIQLHITDDSSGVGEVTIHVEGSLIYDSTNEDPEYVYDSTGDDQEVRGICRRVGTALDYTYVFQTSTLYDYEQEVKVEVNATDMTDHVMATDTYSFFTLMRTFGKNIKVNTDTGTLAQHYPDTAMDSQGNIWVVWEHAVAPGDSDIYIGKLPKDGSAFESSQLVFGDSDDQLRPAIAIDDNDKIYVVWQSDDLNDFRDIFVSTSVDVDGIVWSPPVKVNSNDLLNENNQTSPAIAIDGTGKAYIAWEDNRKGNSDIDIWAASSSDATTWTPTSPDPIASAAGNQTEPFVSIDLFDNTAYIFWTDAGGTNTDIIASKNSNNTWNDNSIVTTPSNQSSPAVSITNNSVIHLVWIDRNPDYVGIDDIFYGNNALGLPINDGISIVDQSGARPRSPSIAANDAIVYACWEDSRNLSINNNDTDIYYTSKSNDSEFRTNVLVNDDIGTFTQMNPVIGIYMEGGPYMVWGDDREGNNDIYATASTTVGPILATDEVDAISGGTVEVDNTSPGIVDNENDVIIEIPPGALPADTIITIAELINPPSLPPGGFGVFYEFGPSGLVFSQPVTMTIPHAAADCPGHAAFAVYFYNTETGSWSQDGITNVEHLTVLEDPNLPSDVHAIRCNADHFTAFGSGGGAASIPGGGGAVGGGGGGGGGCSVSAADEGNIVEFLLPYIGFIIVLVILTVRDSRIRNARREYRNREIIKQDH